MTRLLPFRRSAALFLGVIALTLAGCGGKHPTATVSGKVTVGGANPLPGGNITFYLVSDPTQVAGSVINSDGTYEVTNAPVGECKVVVDNSNLDTSKHGDMMGGTAGAGMGGMGGAKMGAQPVMPGQSAGTKEKMKSSTTKGTEHLDSAMTTGSDTGTKKFVRIDPAFSKVETTSLRHTVNKTGDSNVTLDVK